MTAFAPAITRSRELLVNKGTEVALKLVPYSDSDVAHNRKYFAKFVSALGILTLLFLLLINTLLAQDAFTLSHLKLEARMVSDEREAIARKMDTLSSPANLAKAATSLGMKPSNNPTFLTLAPTNESAIKHG